MVSGINISSPPLSGSGKNAGDAVKPVKIQNTAAPENSSQASRAASSNVSSAIVKTVEKRIDVLTSGNTAEFLNAAEKFINASLPSKPPGTRLRINLDSGSGRFVYQGIDIKTGEVVTQFPAEEILKQLAFVRKRENANGIVVDKKV